MSFEDTTKYINSLCTSMYNSIKDEIKNSSLKSTSFNESKEFFLNRSTTSNEVVINQLYESLQNRLMDVAVHILEDQPVSVKNAFYEKNFRNVMEEWRQGEPGKLTLLNNTDIGCKDPRIAIITCVTGSVFVVWLAILLFIKSKSLSIMAIKATLALVSIFATYIVSYNSSLNTMHNSLRTDVIKMLDENERITNNWLERALKFFQSTFDEFCTVNNIDVRR